MTCHATTRMTWQYATTRSWWRSKEEKGSQILTPIKLLTRLPILSAQIKAGIHTNYKMKSDKY